MKHKRREHVGAHPREVEPQSVAAQILHEVTKIPEHVWDTYTEEDHVDDCTRGADHNEDGEDKINQNHKYG